MTMKVKLTARDSAVQISDKTFVVREEPLKPFLQTLESEVKNNPKQAKKLMTELTKTRTMLTSLLVVVPTTEAIPPDLKNGLLIVIAILAFLGVVTAVVCLMLSGMWKMLFGEKVSDEWNTNIYKGLLQVILAPVTVAFIVGLCCLLFGGLPAFQPIKDPITTFFNLG